MPRIKLEQITGTQKVDSVGEVCAASQVHFRITAQGGLIDEGDLGLVRPLLTRTFSPEAFRLSPNIIETSITCKDGIREGESPLFNLTHRLEHGAVLKALERLNRVQEGNPLRRLGLVSPRGRIFKMVGQTVFDPKKENEAQITLAIDVPGEEKTLTAAARWAANQVNRILRTVQNYRYPFHL